MFTKLIYPFERRVSPWLGTNERLFTLKLTNIQNLFDAHSLWDHRYGGSKDIIEKVTGQSDLRLRAALDVHRCITSEVDKRGWQAIIEKVFSDVVVWIPQTVWQQDSELGGKNLMVLSDNLKRLHQEDLGSVLLDNRAPSYVIMPDANLLGGEAIFQFGLGVFAPCKADQLIAQIQIRIRNRTNWQTLPEWIFWKNGRMVKRPAGIYQQQIGLILGAAPQFCTVKTLEDGQRPLWFSHGKGSIFINYALRSEKFAFGDGVYINKGEILALDRGNGSTIFEFKNSRHIVKDASNIGEALLLKVEHVADNFSQPEAKFPKNDKIAAAARRYDTIVPRSSAFATMDFTDGDEGRRKTGIQGPHLFLEGYALPGIDKMKVSGLRNWVLWIDEVGRPVNSLLQNVEEEAQQRLKCLALTAINDRSELYVRKPMEKKFVAIKNFPWRLENENGVFYELIAPPENSYYLGILQIPQPERFFLLEDTPLVLGRVTPGSADNPDVDLDVLTNPRSLFWEKGRKRKGTYLGAISLSREHVKVEGKGEQMQVEQLSRTSPAFGVKNDGSVERLEPSTSKEIRLEPGERLLFGCCLLKYENPGLDPPQREN